MIWSGGLVFGFKKNTNAKRVAVIDKVADSVKSIAIQFVSVGAPGMAEVAVNALYECAHVR